VKQIKNALISVFHKDGLEPIIETLDALGIAVYSTGGTRKFIEERGIAVNPVEDLTGYPSILGGRVKTLHPKVFGGILGRRELDDDVAQLESYDIPEFDLVIVDLYPFEATVASGASEQDIIEKIDIGGISLIRAAAKNFKDVIIVSSMSQYDDLLTLLQDRKGSSAIEDRKSFAKHAFAVSSHYDLAIRSYFTGMPSAIEFGPANELRYGENPHQKGVYYGDMDSLFDKHHGKELSYNNFLDVDAAVNLIEEFWNDEPTFAITKHNNACGLATRADLKSAYVDALAGDPQSAFGGVLICNTAIDLATAQEINTLFCEVVVAPAFDADALELLKSKKNRILLSYKRPELPKSIVRTALNGYLWQERDMRTDSAADFTLKTKKDVTAQEKEDLVFASKIAKHTKSNTIVLAKGKQLCASGTGQTSRVDALNQAIEKANRFNFDLQGAVMASDAFFPFPDCVEIAHNAGVNAVVQPGGSIKDELSISFCDEHDMAMVFTGSRHFKH
jgi:phosphoribosylaminoimidazolecarboxamide formyltransferase/IMP cyclohydrolase